MSNPSETETIDSEKPVDRTSDIETIKMETHEKKIPDNVILHNLNGNSNEDVDIHPELTSHEKLSEAPEIEPTAIYDLFSKSAKALEEAFKIDSADLFNSIPHEVSQVASELTPEEILEKAFKIDSADIFNDLSKEESQVVSEPTSEEKLEEAPEMGGLKPDISYSDKTDTIQSHTTVINEMPPTNSDYSSDIEETKETQFIPQIQNNFQ